MAGSLCLFLALTVAVAPGARAKGRSAPVTYAVVEGPGLRHPIVFFATGVFPEIGGQMAEEFANFITRTGAWPGQVSSEGGPFGRPPGTLGPRYRITYFVDRATQAVRQDLFPFASAGTSVFTPSGQQLAFMRVFGPRSAWSGWFRDPEGDVLLASLVARGLPRPAPPVSFPEASDEGSIPLLLVGFGLLATLLLGAFARRSMKRGARHQANTPTRSPQ